MGTKGTTHAVVRSPYITESNALPVLPMQLYDKAHKNCAALNIAHLLVRHRVLRGLFSRFLAKPAAQNQSHTSANVYKPNPRPGL
jgi:hypothetical protein